MSLRNTWRNSWLSAEAQAEIMDLRQERDRARDEAFAAVQRHVNAAVNAYIAQRDSRTYDDTDEGLRMKEHSMGMVNGAIDMSILVDRILLDLGWPEADHPTITGNALCAEIMESPIYKARTA